MIMCKFRHDAFDAYCYIAKQHDFCKDEENCPVFKLLEENEGLKKNALVWHKVTCFDEPDEDGYITNDNPSDLGTQYLIRLKRGDFVVQKLTDFCNHGVVLEDYEWEDVDAWAELQEDDER